MDGERGQATAEYVGVVALVAVVLAVGVTLASPGGVVNAVLGQIDRALCLVGGGTCEPARPKPCVVRADRVDRNASLSIGLVRLDDDHVLLRERLSDGTIRLTVARNRAAGVETAIGGSVDVKVKGFGFKVGGQLTATALALLGNGRVYLARDDREADRITKAVKAGLPFGLDGPVKLVKSLLGKGPPKPPKPDARFLQAGAQGELGGEASVPGASAKLSALSKALIGGRRDRRTGETTYYLRAERGVGVLASAVLGVAGDIGAIGMLSVTVDRAGRTTDVGLLASGDASNTPLPGTLSALLKQAKNSGDVSLKERAGRRWELEAHVDPDDLEIGPAWAAFKRSPLSVAALRRLGEMLRDRARVDVRTYATTSDRQAAGGKVSLGGSFGGKVSREQERFDLLAAQSRPSGGVWEPRVDCVK